MPYSTGQGRGDVTRRRVVDAAIEAFGMEGFDRTTTRALVRRAGTNLVSIHYHFGSKEAVYLAAAEHIGTTIRERNRAVVERGLALAEDPAATRAALVEAVCAIYEDFATMVLAGGIPESWRRFITREQVQPSGTGAFDAMFNAIRPLFEAIFGLIARLLDLPRTHHEVRLLSTMILGQVSVFRTNQAGALRLLEWREFGPAEMQQIRAVARKYIVKLLSDAEPTEPQRAPSRTARSRKRVPKGRRGASVPADNRVTGKT